MLEFRGLEHVLVAKSSTKYYRFFTADSRQGARTLAPDYFLNLINLNPTKPYTITRNPKPETLNLTS
jgi:hypothetical protein